MKHQLNILHLEDDPKDAALVKATLVAGGIACSTTRVENRADFIAALERSGIDLVLSDFTMPTFDGMSAVHLLRAKWPNLPVILVSGTLGEERVVEALKAGATDYVLKGHLARLVPAVRRAMQEVATQEEIRLSEVNLREAEQQLRIVFSQSPLGMGLVGRDGHPFLTNAALQKMLGYTGEELSRMTFADITHPDDRATDQALYQELMQGNRTSYQMEKRYRHKNGQVVFARLSVHAARGTSSRGDFAIGTVEDITERRQLEAQFIEAQKMDVIGRLASGVAHDFNNILAVIMGYTDMLAARLGADTPERAYSEEIRHAADRAAGLTRQLLVFGRKQAVQLTVLDVNVVAQDSERMLRRLIGENIEMALVLGKSTGHIKADFGYIGQVLMNLAINARDAMPGGGKLTISTSKITLDEKQARQHENIKPGHYVMLSIHDTGTGMTDDVKKHLFEAFFTTKPLGEGTGLGLATCKTIVQQCGGHIEVLSEIGKGTTFRIYFPRIDDPVGFDTQFIQSGPVPGGTETLLVVEDDAAVRQLAGAVLAALGYKVLSAANGQEALRMVHAHKGSPLGLVISDVIMPLMGGPAMAEWLKTTYPNLKILFTSGFTDDPAFQDSATFLPKPYTTAMLGRKVRAMLDA